MRTWSQVSCTKSTRFAMPFRLVRRPSDSHRSSRQAATARLDSGHCTKSMLVTNSVGIGAGRTGDRVHATEAAAGHSRLGARAPKRRSACLSDLARQRPLPTRRGKTRRNTNRNRHARTFEADDDRLDTSGHRLIRGVSGVIPERSPTPVTRPLGERKATGAPLAKRDLRAEAEKARRLRSLASTGSPCSGANSRACAPAHAVTPSSLLSSRTRSADSDPRLRSSR